MYIHITFIYNYIYIVMMYLVYCQNMFNMCVYIYTYTNIHIQSNIMYFDMMV